jgi:4-amino-4-deoxy-L-arabinose transferase-like glycosyltransferase
LSRRLFFALLLLSLLAVALVILATRLGIGVTPDSTVYLEAARNLIGGRGLIALAADGELRPMTHYPPLYSSLLALIGLAHLSIEGAARWLQAFIFGANILLVGFVIARSARNSFWLPIVGALLTLTAPDVVAVNTLALSEPLFILLAVGCLAALAEYLKNVRPGWLVLAASLAALALLTRYVGVTSIVTGVAALLLLPKRDWRRRLASAVVFGAIACLPMVLWFIRNVSRTGSQTDRHMIFHPPGLKQFVVAFSTVASWLLAGKVRGDLRIGIFVAETILAVLFLLYLRKRIRHSSGADDAGRVIDHDKNFKQLPLVLTIFIVSYMGFIIIATSLFDLVIFDERTLLPVHVVSIVLVLVCASRLLVRFPNIRGIRLALVLAAIAVLGSYFIRTASWFERTRDDGQGYASRQWKESETVQRVRRLAPGIPIYSNAPDGIYFLTGRPAILVPEKTVFVTGRPNQNYETELAQMGSRLKTGGGALVYFNTLPERWYLPSESELRMKLELTEIAKGTDGSILGSPAKNNY